jgi:hypothetical protein
VFLPVVLCCVACFENNTCFPHNTVLSFSLQLSIGQQTMCIAVYVNLILSKLVRLKFSCALQTHIKNEILYLCMILYYLRLYIYIYIYIYICIGNKNLFYDLFYILGLSL